MFDEHGAYTAQSEAELLVFVASMTATPANDIRHASVFFQQHRGIKFSNILFEVTLKQFDVPNHF